jgi:methyl-accepting chemotaxis protein
MLLSLGRRAEPPAVTEQEPSAGTTAPSHAEEALAGVRETLDLVEDDLKGTSRAIGEAMDAVHEATEATAGALRGIRAQTQALSDVASGLAETSSSLSAATHELGAASADIENRAGEAKRLATNAAEAADTTRQSVGELNRSTLEIGAVVNLIADIAKQTNLLALNATIEAARAGEAGRGFAVVASEVKNLSIETQRATEEIRLKIAQLQTVAQASVEAVQHIASVIDTIQPVFEAVSASVDQQRSVTATLGSLADRAQGAVGAVSASANEIDSAAADAVGIAGRIEHSGQMAAHRASDLERRLVLFLRQTEAGDRRRDRRRPASLAAEVQAGGRTRAGRTVDLSEGGVLIDLPRDHGIAAGARVNADIRGIGAVPLVVRGVSPLGIHCAFGETSAEANACIAAAIARLDEDHRVLVERATGAAAAIGRLIETAIGHGELTMEQLFDTRYRLIPGTNPPQFDQAALAALEKILPDIQEATRAEDKRMTFCAAVDRNGYLPVHNRDYSHPPRPDDVAWNVAHCRNKRIFDDRAGLAAARNMRPFLIQSYQRDMGGGRMVMMMEVDAPIRIAGRHWGAVRNAYAFGDATA